MGEGTLVSSNPIISIVVPTFNRPSMLRELIASYELQDFDNSELVISDDSDNDLTYEVVNKAMIEDSRIKYFKNQRNLGFCENYKASINRASGDFVLTLGDDDILTDVKSVSRYVRAFQSNPTVHVIYSNQVQPNQDLDFDNGHRYFQTTKIFKNGKEALQLLWLKSIQIAGLAFRKDEVLKKMFPNIVLFPQSYLVFDILRKHDGMGLSEFLIGTRSHRDGDQLGLHAIRGERIRGSERHGNVEISELINKLEDRELKQSLRIELAENFARNLPNEKIVGSLRIALRNLHSLVSMNKTILFRSPILVFSTGITIFFPSRVLVFIRDVLKNIERSNFEVERGTYIEMLAKIKTYVQNSPF